MILPKFTYLAPKTLDEAIAVLQEYGTTAKILAGGTDTINPLKENALKEDAENPEYIVDIKNIPGLDDLSYSAETGLHIGCLTKIYDVEHSAIVKHEYPSLAGAAHVIASNQIRSRGTIVGNVCNASASADSIPTLMVLGAKVEISGPKGIRESSIEELYQCQKPRKIALEDGELVTGIRVPPLKENSCAAYIKHAYRKAMDLAIVGVAVWIRLDGEVVQEAMIAMASVGPRTMRATNAENELIGKPLTEKAIESAAKAASAECKARNGIRASEEYKRAMIEVYTKRVIRKAVNMMGKPGEEYTIE